MEEASRFEPSTASPRTSVITSFSRTCLIDGIPEHSPPTTTMATARVDDATLTVSFTTAEKVAGLLRDQRIPLTAVGAVEVVPDGLRAVRGLRAPGLALPGRRKLGTWRSDTGRVLVAVHGCRPAVRIALEGQRYTSLLITTDAPEELLASLSHHAR